MKKKRITISVKKAAVLLSVICAAGVICLALSILFAPDDIRLASAAVAAGVPDTAVSGETAGVPEPAPQKSSGMGQGEAHPASPAGSSLALPQETERPPEGVQSRGSGTFPAVSVPAAAVTASDDPKKSPQVSVPESRKKPPQTPQSAKPAIAPVKTTPSRAIPVSGRSDRPPSVVPPSSAVTPPVEPKPVTPGTAIPQAREIQIPSVQAVPAGSAGTLVFVFDDAGHNLAQLQKFLSLPFPVTIAVLPSLPYSVQAAQQIRAAGKEVILHQPMQAKNLALDPGPGAITKDMNPGEIFNLVTENVRQIGPIAGINNHEGSLITESGTQITAVLDVCRTERIYFLDSRTTAQTAAPVAAAEKNMKIWERAIFLDNSKKRADMEQALLDGLKVAEKKGLAILIGHVWSPELADLLKDWYPELKARGFACTTISALIR